MKKLWPVVIVLVVCSACENIVRSRLATEEQINPLAGSQKTDPSEPGASDEVMSGLSAQVNKSNQLFYAMWALSGLISEADFQFLWTEYTEVSQSLPAQESLESFSSIHMMTVSHLAYRFSERLVVNGSANMANFFAGTEYASIESSETPAALWASEQKRRELAVFLLEKLWGGEFSEEIVHENASLIEDLKNQRGNTTNDTIVILRSVVSQILASAVMFK